MPPIHPFHRLTFTSSYSQKMRQISCKIFNQFYIPEISRKEFRHPDTTPTFRWIGRWASEEATYNRAASKPLDLEPTHNWSYYPAHPQIREFSHILREYGLYRDEHRDYKEETTRMKVMKGKRVVNRLYGDQRTKKKK